MKVVSNQITLASILIAVMVVAGFVLNFYLAHKAIQASNHTWCVVLTELTTHRPAHENGDAINFYNNLVRLEQHFGC